MSGTSSSRPSVVLVAVAGGSGSGKTWLAGALQRRLAPHAGLLSLDDFYRDLSHLPLARRARTNFDSPAAIDWAAFEVALRAIARGETPRLPRYDFAHHTRAPQGRRWRRRRIVIIEGLWPWVKPRLRALFALRLFRDAEAEVRFARRLSRDVAERGRTSATVTRQWQTQVEPMYGRHVAPQQRSAHVVIGVTVSAAQLSALAKRIRGLAQTKPEAGRKRRKRTKKG